MFEISCYRYVVIIHNGYIYIYHHHISSAVGNMLSLLACFYL